MNVATASERDWAADRAICEAASPLPWTKTGPHNGDDDGKHWFPFSHGHAIYGADGIVANTVDDEHANADFFIRARTDWPLAIQRIEDLLQQLDREIKDRAYYADLVHHAVAAIDRCGLGPHGRSVAPGSPDQPSKELEVAIDKLAGDILRMRNWVADLQSGMFINCVYCGHRYGPRGEVPEIQADILKAHIEQCPEHPMSALKAENARLVDALNFDRTGLAQGLNDCRNAVNGWWWIAEGGWGSYELDAQTEETLRKEFSYCYDLVNKTAEKFLRESGERAVMAIQNRTWTDPEQLRRELAAKDAENDRLRAKLVAAGLES